MLTIARRNVLGSSSGGAPHPYSFLLYSLSSLVLAFVFLPALPAKELATPGIMAEFTASLNEVRTAVLAVQRDHIAITAN